MKFLTYITFLFVAFSLLPIHYAHAQDSAIDDMLPEEVVLDEDVESEEDANHETSNSEIEEVENDKVLNLEEVKALIESIPTSSDAVKGTVSTDIDNEYYDIYGRSLAFRESAKELRASIDERRAVFEVPRIEILELYRYSKEKVYAAEMAAYNEGESNTPEADDGDILDEDLGADEGDVSDFDPSKL